MALDEFTKMLGSPLSAYVTYNGGAFVGVDVDSRIGGERFGSQKTNTLGEIYTNETIDTPTIIRSAPVLPAEFDVSFTVSHINIGKIKMGLKANVVRANPGQAYSFKGTVKIPNLTFTN